MMLRRSLCIWQAINVVSAIKWEGAKSTNGASLVIASINPRPTALAELVKRDAWPASYCGFAGGNESQGATCSSHSSCVWNTDYFVVGCCATASLDCLFYTSCIDDTSPATDADDSLVFTCRGTKTCYENNYPSNYRQWGCGHNATSILLTYANMSADAATIQQAFIGTKELLAQTTLTATATSSVTITATPKSSSGVSTGTIVGAAVGGSALLVIGAVIIVFLLLRHRKDKNHTVPGTMSGPSQMSSPTMGQTMSPHPSATYSNKDQSLPIMVANLPDHSFQTHSSNQNQFQEYQHPASHVQMPNQGDTMYEAYRPPRSPPAAPLSPTPREMDGRSLRTYEQPSRKPVAGSVGSTPLYPQTGSRLD